MPAKIIHRLFKLPQSLWAAASGALLVLAYPPWDLWPLAFVGLVPLCLIFYRQDKLASAGAGFCFGLALCLGQMYWISHSLIYFGGIHWSMAVFLLVGLMAYLALYTALFAFITAGLRQLGVSPVISAPLAWAGTEWLRGLVLTGFPWLPLGSALGPCLPLVQSAEVWGSGGLSAMVVLINALLSRAALQLLDKKNPGFRALAALGLAGFIIAGAWAWGSGRLQEVRAAMAGAPKALVSVVQGNIPLLELHDKKLLMPNLAKHQKLTQKAAREHTERPLIVVWSESAGPFYFMHQARPTQAVLDVAKSENAYILIGTMGSAMHQGKVKPTNRTWLAGPDGRAVSFYDKVHLVPYGEYVPFGEYFYFIRALAAGASDFAPGTQGRLLQAGRVRLGPLICYESIFPELARAQRARGAQLIVNQTNDAWFGTAGASAQHMRHLVLRCVENRLACARSANTGISGFVGPDGALSGLIGLFTQGAESRSLPLMDMQTFYTARGDLVGPAGLAACALAWAMAFLARRRKKP